MKFQPADHKLFFTKNDPDDRRLGEFVNSSSSIADLKLLQPQLSLWGYPDDEGILMNGGRAGARLAPPEIRHFFYRMTCPENSARSFRMLDFGNVDVTLPLAERHEQGRILATEHCKANIPFVALGGGHDYGYCETTGFLSHFTSAKESSKKPVVINIDAHLDVRPIDKGFHSGTPFRRALTEFKNEFHFFEVGLQPQCNSPQHAQWAENQGAKLFWLNGHESTSQVLQQVRTSLQTHRGSPVFLSVDIDAFSSQIAPGCSQSWPTGLELAPFLEFMAELKTQFQLAGLGIYEVSPPLDVVQMTSKLAAILVHRFAFGENI
jgi:formiminoglutamase